MAENTPKAQEEASYIEALRDHFRTMLHFAQQLDFTQSQPELYLRLHAQMHLYTRSMEQLLKARGGWDLPDFPQPPVEKTIHYAIHHDILPYILPTPTQLEKLDSFFAEWSQALNVIGTHFSGDALNLPATLISEAVSRYHAIAIVRLHTQHPKMVDDFVATFPPREIIWNRHLTIFAHEKLPELIDNLRQGGAIVSDNADAAETHYMPLGESFIDISRRDFLLQQWTDKATFFHAFCQLFNARDERLASVRNYLNRCTESDDCDPQSGWDQPDHPWLDVFADLLATSPNNQGLPQLVADGLFSKASCLNVQKLTKFETLSSLRELIASKTSTRHPVWVELDARFEQCNLPPHASSQLCQELWLPGVLDLLFDPHEGVDLRHAMRDRGLLRFRDGLTNIEQLRRAHRFPMKQEAATAIAQTAQAFNDHVKLTTIRIVYEHLLESKQRHAEAFPNPNAANSRAWCLMQARRACFWLLSPEHDLGAPRGWPHDLASAVQSSEYESPVERKPEPPSLTAHAPNLFLYEALKALNVLHETNHNNSSPQTRTPRSRVPRGDKKVDANLIYSQATAFLLARWTKAYPNHAQMDHPAALTYRLSTAKLLALLELIKTIYVGENYELLTAVLEKWVTIVNCFCIDHPELLDMLPDELRAMNTSLTSHLEQLFEYHHHFVDGKIESLPLLETRSAQFQTVAPLYALYHKMLGWLRTHDCILTVICEPQSPQSARKDRSPSTSPRDRILLQLYQTLTDKLPPTSVSPNSLITHQAHSSPRRGQSPRSEGSRSSGHSSNTPPSTPRDPRWYLCFDATHQPLDPRLSTLRDYFDDLVHYLRDNKEDACKQFMSEHKRSTTDQAEADYKNYLEYAADEYRHIERCYLAFLEQLRIHCLKITTDPKDSFRLDESPSLSKVFARLNDALSTLQQSIPQQRPYPHDNIVSVRDKTRGVRMYLKEQLARLMQALAHHFSIDTIYRTQAFEHYTPIQKAYHELYRSLSKQGITPLDPKLVPARQLEEYAKAYTLFSFGQGSKPNLRTYAQGVIEHFEGKTEQEMVTICRHIYEASAPPPTVSNIARRSHSTGNTSQGTGSTRSDSSHRSSTGSLDNLPTPTRPGRDPAASSWLHKQAMRNSANSLPGISPATSVHNSPALPRARSDSVQSPPEPLYLDGRSPESSPREDIKQSSPREGIKPGSPRPS